MKGKIRIILDELRDIERTEGLGAITEGKINEICKAQGVSFDEFKSSVLKMLAEEAGISLDELNSFLLEEIGELEKISELDLDKISGGASVSDAVKRGAASLMAILNLSSISNSYAGMPDSAKVRRDNGAVISKSKVVLSKEEILEKWAKRLGASTAGIALTLAVIGLNKLKNKENNASGDKAKTISVEELKRMNWMCLGGEQAREIATEIFTLKGTYNNKLSLKSKFYVHMSEGIYRGNPMYVIGYIDGSEPGILISDDCKYLQKRKNSGTVQIFENGLINYNDERVKNVIWGLKQSYIFNNSISLSGGEKVTTGIPKWFHVAKHEEGTGQLSDGTDFTVPSGNDIATKLSEYKQYYVYLTDHYNPTSALRIVGVSEDNRSLLISDDFSCSFLNDAQKLERFNSNVVSYDNLNDLVENGIIARLRLAYQNVESIDKVNMQSKSQEESDIMVNVSSSDSSSGSSSWEPDKSILMEAEKIYESEHKHTSTINEKIKKLKIKRLALQLSSPTLRFEEAKAAMTDIEAELYRLEKESKYFKETQKNNWQCKFASTVCPEFSHVLEAFGFSTNFDDLALGIIGTEDMDHYLDEDYQANLTGDTWKKAMANPPTGRTSSRYMPLFSDGMLLHTLKKIVRKSRPAMLLNLFGKTLTRNSEKSKKSKKNVGVLHGLDQKIINNKKIIDDLSEAIQDMNAYHQCSGDTFQKMLETGSVLSMDRQRSPFIGKTDQEKLRYIWKSLDDIDMTKPTEDFEKLIKNYDKPGVADFLKTCVGGQRWSKIFQDLWENSVRFENISVNTLRTKPYVFSIDALDNDLERNENERIKRVDTKFQQAARTVCDYMRKVKSTKLISHQPGGLSATKDAVAGTTTTVFSILGGNKMAIEEYALKCKSPDESIESRKGCIIEIPNRCVSYVSPYALLLDADYNCIASNINSKKDSYAVVNGKNNGIKVDMNGINMNVTNGLIALADSPYVTAEWANSIDDGQNYGPKYKTNYGEVDDYESKVDNTDLGRQISQMLRSRKLDPSNEKCATALAIYMFCQYVILHNGYVPKDAEEVLGTSYQEVGSHACMEGHSPGEIPLGNGGIERVLLIGYRDNDEDVVKAKKKGLKVNCIDYVPKTRKDFIAAFNECK